MSPPQVTITAYALSMRKQPCTSSGPWNWTLAALVPGLSWAMNTWKWRTRQLPSRPTGQSLYLFIDLLIMQLVSDLLNWHCEHCFMFQFYNSQACYWSEQAWLPCLVWLGSDVWDPQDALLLFVLLSKGSPAQVWILTEDLGYDVSVKAL